MIAAFLTPYALRGVAAPYLWVFYKLLSSFDEPMALLLSDDYLVSADDPRLADRGELDPVRMRAMGYGVPSTEMLQRHHIARLDSGLLERLLEQHEGNPLAVFKAFLSEEIEELKEDLRACFDALPDDLEAVLTWCNCPSLTAVARERGLRVVHLEMGPLREPAYRGTAYFDFSGVNGGTEAQQRYAACTSFDPGLTSFADMRMAFEQHPVQAPRRGGRLGVVLQVEDDSNLLCFSNGFDNTSLIARGLLLGGAGRVLVRSHPGSRFALRPGTLAVDDSVSSAEFLSLCDQVLTINSSVGLEALLRDVPVQVHGDSSFKFIADEQDAQARSAQLAFYLLAYLVPYELVFSPDYIRFRLADPDESQIMLRHYRAYCPADERALDSLDVQSSFASMRESCVVAAASEPAAAVVAEARDVDEGCRLYYRGVDEHFSEHASLRAQATADGRHRRVRFLLPPGELPSFIRFDPGHHPASFELTGISWGWGEEAGEHELQTLPDVALRVSAIGGLVDRDRGEIKSFSDCGDSFFECSIDDLWGAVQEIESGCGILEFHFIERSLELEAAHGHTRVEAMLTKLGSGEGARLDALLQLLEQINSSSGLQISRIEELQALVGQLSASLDHGDAAIEAMDRDVTAIITFLRNKPTLWARIMGRAP